jgi:hypothetical protein
LRQFNTLQMISRSLLAVMALLPALALAQPALDTFTGAWLYERYLGFKREDAVDSSMFALYVSGVVDRELISQRVEGVRPRWCQPEGAIMAQYLHIVGRYLENHPERHEYHRAQLIMESLQQAWPCRGTGTAESAVTR